MNSSMYNPIIAEHVDSHPSMKSFVGAERLKRFGGLHDESSRPGLATTQDKGRYGQCGCSCTVLLYDTRFVQSFSHLVRWYP